jgi:hypothetical protein
MTSTSAADVDPRRPGSGGGSGGAGRDLLPAAPRRPLDPARARCALCGALAFAADHGPPACGWSLWHPILTME